MDEYLKEGGRYLLENYNEALKLSVFAFGYLFVVLVATLTIKIFWESYDRS